MWHTSRKALNDEINKRILSCDSMAMKNTDAIYQNKRHKNRLFLNRTYARM